MQVKHKLWHITIISHNFNELPFPLCRSLFVSEPLSHYLSRRFVVRNWLQFGAITSWLPMCVQHETWLSRCHWMLGWMDFIFSVLDDL